MVEVRTTATTTFDSCDCGAADYDAPASRLPSITVDAPAERACEDIVSITRALMSKLTENGARIHNMVQTTTTTPSITSPTSHQSWSYATGHLGDVPASLHSPVGNQGYVSLRAQLGQHELARHRHRHSPAHVCNFGHGGAVHYCGELGHCGGASGASTRAAR